ncbi:CLIP domain-containing serine protease B4-like [Eriocheir sinensis]|uniref:CLIP domain-containing serine protease B4-like n=1 Tax=Eriocheir sinensis TaxID=95602 RepID=UPI0021C70B22|nr:CLIP domain-containing serine protease B4-like [Eriocheir sinensis]XP_050723556.1 CLIP domain-containing serine protease B4-like [Eriocheir sinensis]
MRDKRDGGGGREGSRLLILLLFLSSCLASVHAHFGSCEDHTRNCRGYAERGDCENPRTRQFMLQNCPESCNSCVDPNCYDRSRRCSGNAQQGLCETQKSFMLQQCPHSCDACRIGTINTVALTDIKTIIKPDFQCGLPIQAAGRKKRQIIFPDEFAALTSVRARPQAAQRPPGEIITLGMAGAPTSVEDTFCGATPITKRFLLTAAHCVFDPNRRLTNVRLGELDFAVQGEENSRPVDYTVQQIYVHPDFDPSSLERYNDVALIQTVEQIEFNDLVYPYCISENAPAPGTVVTGAGFGLANATFRPSRLQEAALEVLENSQCEQRYRDEQALPQLMQRYPELLQGKSILCASYPQRGSCQGDSGGPLYELRNGKRYLVGIVSTGVSCRGNGVSTLPGLYVNVADHVGFINSVVHSPALL